MSENRLMHMMIVVFGISMSLVGIYLAIYPITSPSTSLPVNENISRLVTVPSTVMWYDTGIDIKSGTTVKIDYKGGSWTNQKGSFSVDGQGKQLRRSDLIVPQSNLASLVAKVGSNTFHVGNSYSGIPGNGRLYLSLNDVAKMYNDNDGNLRVNISSR